MQVADLTQGPYRQLPNISQTWHSLFIICPIAIAYKKLSYCWETVRRESMPRIAEMDVEMTT